jgi:hypothetical protein
MKNKGFSDCQQEPKRGNTKGGRLRCSTDYANDLALYNSAGRKVYGNWSLLASSAEKQVQVQISSSPHVLPDILVPLALKELMIFILSNFPTRLLQNNLSAKVIRDRFPPLARPAFPHGGIVDTHYSRPRKLISHQLGDF